MLHGFNFGHSKVTLVFECGWGLTFNSNGSHWVENPRDIASMTRETKDKIAALKRESEEIKLEHDKWLQRDKEYGKVYWAKWLAQAQLDKLKGEG